MSIYREILRFVAPIGRAGVSKTQGPYKASAGSNPVRPARNKQKGKMIKYHNVKTLRVMENDKGELFLMVVTDKKKSSKVLYVPIQTINKAAELLNLLEEEDTDK